MIAKVIVDITASELDKIFDYLITTENVVLGSRVIVPFGKIKTEGFVIEIAEKSEYPENKLKPIIRVVDEIPALTSENLALAKYIKEKYHTTYASVLRLFLPSEMRTGKVRARTVKFAELKSGVEVSEVIKTLRKNSENQIGVLEYLQKNGKEKCSVLNEKFSNSSVNALEKKGYITFFEERENRSPYVNLDNNGVRVNLTSEQKSAVETVMNSSKPTLIFGVTGSGKTEVYLQIIERTIKSGKTAIMLVPEIALTPQTLQRLRSRFLDNCAILHSGLSVGERFDEWWRLRSGEAKIVVGARSAIFAPVENVGVIIIDEEHEQSYESEVNPRYETGDLARFRAEYNGAKLVMGSATPKLESFLKAENGEYTLAKLTERVNGRPMPEIIVSDMRQEIMHGNPSAFSSILKQELENCLKNGNQAMIFLNRRGYSQKVICRECGYFAKCENCSVSLTYHKADNLLKCHYCGTAYNMLEGCPDCGSVNINYSGTGTQKVVSELKELFPSARFLRMDNDTTRNKEGHFKILKEFADGNADILVGTQMIAKGHDFKNVTLVGILDADMSMYFQDFRALERTFQLITQVAGRSGRADQKGKVVLQTYSPKNSVLNYCIRYDYEGFYKSEIAVRKATHFPPFADIVRLMVEGDDEKLTIETLKNVFFACREVYEKYQSSFVYFDKMKSPVKRINNKYRFQVLARIKDNYKQIEDEFFEIALKYTTNKVLCYNEINPSNLS